MEPISPTQKVADEAIPPQDAADEAIPPQDVADEADPPQDAAHEPNPPQDAAHEPNPPQDAAHKINPPDQEATELETTASPNRPGLVRTESKPKGRVLLFWQRHVSLAVPHAACRDHLGMFPTDFSPGALSVFLYINELRGSTQSMANPSWSSKRTHFSCLHPHCQHLRPLRRPECPAISPK